MKYRFAAILALIIVIGVFAYHSGFKNLSTQSPDIKLMGLDEKMHHLSEYIGNGKWTIVNIWGPKCPACIEEIPDLVLFHEAHYETDATVLGIALDFPSYGYADLEEVTEFTDSYFIDYPMLLADGEITTQLGANRLKGTPTILAFNPDGELVGEHVGIITKDGIEEFISK